MKSMTLLFMTGAMAIAAAMNLTAADIKIIANPSVTSPSISAEDLKGIFLATKTSLAHDNHDNHDNHVEPVFEKGGPAHEAFLKEYLGKTAAALDIYYRSLVFTGKGAIPKTVASDAEVAAYVAKTKGAIGYVSASAIANGVRTLEVK